MSFFSTGLLSLLLLCASGPALPAQTALGDLISKSTDIATALYLRNFLADESLMISHQTSSHPLVGQPGCISLSAKTGYCGDEPEILNMSFCATPGGSALFIAAEGPALELPPQATGLPATANIQLSQRFLEQLTGFRITEKPVEHCPDDHSCYLFVNPNDAVTKIGLFSSSTGFLVMFGSPGPEWY